MTKRRRELQETNPTKLSNGSPNQDENQFHAIGKTFPDLIHDLFFTTRGLISTGILFALVTSFLACTILLASKNKTKIQVTSQGATLFQVDGRDQSAVFLLPASRLWANTGLKVKKGDCLLIKASGRIHLAGHRLFESATQDSIPFYPWVDADGKTEVQAYQKRSQETNRESHLIAPNIRPGTLLAYLATEKQDEPDFKNPRGNDKGRLYNIGNSRQIKAPSEGTFILYLSVNDVFLTKEDSKMYKRTTASPKGFIGTPDERWKEIEKNDYWNIWFDDNLGDFLVNIEYMGQNDACE
jgi:hypothetical protein